MKRYRRKRRMRRRGRRMEKRKGTMRWTVQ
jgi:hypothetical protein